MCNFAGALVQLAQQVALRSGVDVMNLDIVLLSPSTDMLHQFGLDAFSDQEVKARFCLLKYLNRLVTPLLNYVDITARHLDAGADVETMSLSSVVHRLKDSYFTSTKRSIMDALLAMDSVDAVASVARRRSFRVPINRLVASKRECVAVILFVMLELVAYFCDHCYCRAAADPEGMQTIFGQLYTGLKDCGELLFQFIFFMFHAFM